MRALLASMIGHGVLVASLTQVDRAPRTIEPVDERPIEVDLIEATHRAAHRQPPAVTGQPPADSRQPPADSRPPPAARRPPSAEVPPTPSGMLAMRTPPANTAPPTGSPTGSPAASDAAASPLGGGVDFSPAAVAATVVGADAPTARPAADTTADEYMRPTGGGTFEYEHPGFKGTVARDGTVTFEDTPSVKLEWGVPCLECVGDDFERWKKDPYAGHTVNLLGLLPVLRGSFDLTDWVERLAGNDPYSYEKNKFLEATRDRRAQMSAAEKRDATRAALLQLPTLLAAIWAHDQWSAPKRRRVLFELWDECAETDAGARARATILAFIRRAVDEPYPDDELAELNRARTSTEEFAP